MTWTSQQLVGLWLEIRLLQTVAKLVEWGPFLERPRNFLDSKLKVKIKTCWTVAQFLAHKPVNFASLTDSFFCFIFKIIDTLILNANMANIKQFSGPEKLPGLSRNGRGSFFVCFWLSPIWFLNAYCKALQSIISVAEWRITITPTHVLC